MSFQERKETYFKKLRENKDFINIILEGQETKPGQASKEMVLDPKNDLELTLAESLFQLVNDTKSLLEEAAFYELEPIKVEDSETALLYIKLIKAFRKNDNAAIEEIVSSVSIEKQAMYLYDGIVSVIGQNVEFMRYIADQVGFDIDDTLEAAQFNIYFEKATKVVQEISNKQKFISDEPDEKLVEEFKVFSDEFHRIRKRNKANKNDEN